MIFPETPQGIGSSSNPTTPSTLIDGVEGEARITTLGVGIRFLAMVNQDYGIRTEYFLNTIVDNLHFSRIILVVLVDLPINVQDYKIRIALRQHAFQEVPRFQLCDDTWRLEYQGVRYNHPIRQSDSCFTQLVEPIPPDHLASIKLDIQYNTLFGRTESEYVLPSRELHGKLQSHEAFTELWRSHE